MLSQSERKKYPKINKMRVLAKRSWANPEQRAKRIEGCKNRKYSRQGLKIMRDHQKNVLCDPEVVAKRNYTINTRIVRKRPKLPSLSPETCVVEVDRINDYAGVVTEDEFEVVNG